MEKDLTVELAWLDANGKAKCQEKVKVARKLGPQAIKELLHDERPALEYHLDAKELEALEKDAGLPSRPDQVEPSLPWALP